MDSKKDVMKTTLESGILIITLTRPDALNALNAELMSKLHQTFLAAQENSEVKSLLITGEGKAFCAGADINQLAKLDGKEGLNFARFGQKVFRTLERLGKPSLAAINGFALGGGCELAMSASIRIAATTAGFGQPEVKLGVIPGFGGTQRLARLVGKGRALDLCLTGRMVKAEEALSWGLVTQLFPPENLLSEAKTILTNINKLAPFALQSIMTVIDDGYNLSLEEATEVEAAFFGLCCATKDKREGVSAFLEKRNAVFCGE